jgi:hypothetical protein
VVCTHALVGLEYLWGIQPMEPHNKAAAHRLTLKLSPLASSHQAAYVHDIQPRRPGQMQVNLSIGPQYK